MMKLMNYLAVTGALLTVVLGVGATPAHPAETSGVIKSVGRDHVVIQGPELKDRVVMVSPSTPVMMQMVRPQLDMKGRVFRDRACLRAPEGMQNASRTYPMPVPLTVIAELTPSDMKMFERRGSLTLRGCTFTGRQLPASFPKGDNRKLCGILNPGASGRSFILKVGRRKIPLLFHPAGHKLLEGYSLKDIKPCCMEVSAIGKPDGDRFIAEALRLKETSDPLTWFDPALPKVLVIGDGISLGYSKALHQALLTKVNLHHPGTNCGGTDRGLQCLHHWLGLCMADKRRWDVIAFNFGHGDAELSKEKYLKNLSEIIDKLKRTGAKLIWVSTTPVSYGHNEAGPVTPPDRPRLPEAAWAAIEREATNPVGAVPGRMRLQNMWVRELLKRKYPEVKTCDQWQLVKNGEKGFYRTWWHARNIHFTSRQSIPLARELAKTILQSLDADPKMINPPACHGEDGKGIPELASPLSEKKSL